MPIPYNPPLPQTRMPVIIIGAGGIVGDAHLPAYRKAGFEVAGITNRTRSRAEKLAHDFDIPQVYDSVADAVRDAPENAVYDVTIMPEQFVEVLRQLPDGSAVLIQKPWATILRRAGRYSGFAVKRDWWLPSTASCVFAPYVMQARQMIGQGLLGELYDMEVRVTIHTPWDIFPHVAVHPRLEIQYHSIHYIDLIRSFLVSLRG